MKITWRELTADLAGRASDELLNEWRWLVPATMSIHMISALGDAFLVGASNDVYWLDAGGAELSRIAVNREHFDVLRQNPNNVNQWFAPQLVGNLMSSGQVLGPFQCFSYKIPLTLGGGFNPANFTVCDLSIHFHTLGQIQSQVKNLPVGTPIASIKIGD